MHPQRVALWHLYAHSDESACVLYYPSSVNLEMMSEEENEQLDDRIIETYHLDETFIIQYWTWIKRLVQGDWGYSQVHGEDVLSALLRRLPITVELAIYTMLCFIPLGLISGVQAGANRRGKGNSAFQIRCLHRYLYSSFCYGAGIDVDFLCRNSLVSTATIGDSKLAFRSIR